MNLNIKDDLAIRKFIDSRKVFTSDELIKFISSINNNFNYKYKNNYIKMLCDKNYIYRFYKNYYRKYSKKKYEYYIDKELEQLLNKLLNGANIKIGYINSIFFNNFSSLQSLKNYTYLYVPRYAMQFIEDKLFKENKFSIPSSKLIKLQSILFNNNLNFDFVLKPLSVDAPIIKSKDGASKIIYIKIEGLLIDLITDPYLKVIYGSEIENIFRNVFEIYAINLNTLIRYAKKKGVFERLATLLKLINYNVTEGSIINGR